MKLWNVKNIYITTENSCGAADEPAADGMVYDSDRIVSGGLILPSYGV